MAINYSLIISLTKREISARYKGSLLGIGWSFFAPILMMGVFTFVFGEVFASRWPGSSNPGGISYAAALFAGLTLFTFFSDCISRAPNSLLENPNYIKKVVFPIEIIPIIGVLTSAFQMACSYTILLILIAFSEWSITIHALWLPLIIVPFMMLTLGLYWAISALGVFIRDIGQIISPLLTALMFLSPVLYDLTKLEEKFGWILKLNPVTTPVQESRKVLIYATSPDLKTLAAYTACSIIIYCSGKSLFKKLRAGFADVV